VLSCDAQGAPRLEPIVGVADDGEARAFLVEPVMAEKDPKASPFDGRPCSGMDSRRLSGFEDGLSVRAGA